ncbi:MAG: EF-P lysine aminoacylase EpmA [Rhodospirillaceae bacterium]|nr:EF-P lysine aminoacylase EpmA [Rhodospirillaceae bacterium]
MSDTWWDQSTFAQRRANLTARSQAIGAVRQYFIDQGFMEVETPAIQLSPGIDRHIQPFHLSVRGPFDQQVRSRYLHTSPEFAMKKLLAAGETKIFQICRVFRDCEEGRLHHPEFTMLEWYHANATYDDLIVHLVNLISVAAVAAGQEFFRQGAHKTEVNQFWRRITVADAFAEFANIDLHKEVPGHGEFSADGFVLRAKATGVRCEVGDQWDDVFHRVMLERIEPALADGPPTVLVDFPEPVGALARPKASDPMVCERVEAYVCGIELANGFSELIDPVEQRRRFVRDQNAFAKLYGKPPPIDEDFLSALDNMPESAGMALGIDRLIMLLTGADHIKDVIWAPVDMTVVS